MQWVENASHLLLFPEREKRQYLPDFDRVKDMIRSMKYLYFVILLHCPRANSELYPGPVTDKTYWITRS